MRAVRNTERGIEVLELPAPEGDGVRVRVRSSGICGSDLHMIRFGALPRTLGHEFAGLLDDGTAVAVRPSVHCGACDRCAAGEPNLCRTALGHTHGISLDGGLADEVRVHPGCVFPLPPAVGVSVGALVEPIAVAVHAANRAGLSGGERVLVVGGGTIGLTATAVARARGCEVDLAARHPAQREAGGALGAGVVPEGEYDVVFEAAGSQSALDEAVQSARPGGTVLVASTYWSDVSLPRAFTTREVRIEPALMYGDCGGEPEFATAVHLLARNPDWSDALVSHRFPLDRAPEAFRTAADRAGGSIKVLLEP